MSSVKFNKLQHKHADTEVEVMRGEYDEDET